MTALNETHDPALRSWVEQANAPGSDFPLQNLPFGVFRRAGSKEAFRAGVAIGDQVLDLAAVHAQRIVSGSAGQALAACAGSELNGFMSLGDAAWTEVRRVLSGLLRSDSAQASTLRALLTAQRDCEFAVPARIGDYTDFYASIHHATAVGRLFRPDNPLLPNYRWVPIAYHGRASSIAVSGQQIVRPRGQVLPAGATRPELTASRRLDYELEVGIFVGPGNAPGVPIPIGAAERHVFGLCLLNDWSARDVQAWEYQPLGPFLAKNFATTLSPWIVTWEALAPFRLAWSRSGEEPQPLPYLDSPAVRAAGALDLQLEAWLESARMRAARAAPVRLSHSSFKHSYWTVTQMVAHHTVNGCDLRPGDLLGSGTQSGPLPEEAGSLLELTEGGKRPLTLPDGETRTFLEDGDRVILRGWCEKPGHARVGFGEVSGTIRST